MRICAVVVTFFPTAAVAENICALQKQVDGLVIVDNGSDSSSREIIRNFGEHSKIKVIYNDDNCGVAAALNIGVKYAKNNGYEWIATFDQDSTVTDGMIRTMVQNYDTHPEQEKIGIVAPSYREKATGRLFICPIKAGDDQGIASSFQLAVMTSGNLVNAKMFDVVGYYNEELFIDLVDFDFCFRCAIAGYKILGCRNAVLDHQLGRQTRHIIMGRETTTTNHDAVRRYYGARNRVYVYKKYILRHPRWIASNAWVFFKDTIKVVLLEADRKKKLTHVAHGILDGVVGKVGRKY